MKTIKNSNNYFSSEEKVENQIVNAVFSSIKIEGHKTTKEELKKYYNDKAKHK